MDFKTLNPQLSINDPELVNELYMTKNRYFDKAASTQKAFGVLMGESTLVIKTTEEWAQKRKHLSIAFYKDKIMKMIEMIALSTQRKTKIWLQQYADKPDN